MKQLNQIMLKLAALSLRNAALAGLVVGLLWYFSLYDDGSSIQAKIEETKNLADVEENRVKTADKSIIEAGVMKKQVEEMDAKYKKMAATVPKEINEAQIISVINQMGTASGLAIRGREPKKREVKGVLEELPIKIVAEGRYSEIALFLYNLMSQKEAMRVINFSINRQIGRDAKGRPLNFDLTIGAYRYFTPETKEPSPAQGVKK